MIVKKNDILKISYLFFKRFFYKKTGNMKVAQEFARHSSVTVTQRYTHLSNEELDQKYNKIFNE